MTPDVSDRVDAVVIGASAGGVDALLQILPAFGPATRQSIFVVIHIPRERPSLLAEIFANRCQIPVREAEDKEPIEPGTIYVAPPDYHLLIDVSADSPRRPSIALAADGLVHFSRPSVDVLFESAAETYKERLLGIILTGANADGAAGLASIARHGGVTVVQQPETAHAPLMVESALKKGPVDFVLSLSEIARVCDGLSKDARS